MGEYDISKNDIDRDSIRSYFLRLAREMGDIALHHFRPGEKINSISKDEAKDDPLTIADTEISAFVRTKVARRFLGYNLLTEETGFSVTDDSHAPIIIIDELDGTKNFRDGNPDFCIMIALAEWINDSYVVTVGVIHMPISKKCYSAIYGGGAVVIAGSDVSVLSVNRCRTYVRGAVELSAVVDLSVFSSKYLQSFEPVIASFDRIRQDNLASADRNFRFCAGVEGAALASGDVSFLLNARVANWDVAASSLIVRESGGEVYLVKGAENLQRPKPWTLQLEDPKGYYPIIMTNRRIDAQLFQVLKGT